MIIRPGDITCLRNPWDDIVKPSQKVWRHNPLDGVGVEGPNGIRTYSTQAMDGLMEPHVFARFKKIELQVEFNLFRRFVNNRPIPRLSMDAAYNVTPDVCNRFSSFIQKTRALRDVSTVLSNSLKVSLLRIILDIDADPNFDFHYEPDENPREAAEHRMAYYSAADTRASEIFLESGVLNPLEKLSNIAVADIEYHDYFGCPGQMKQKYERIMVVLKAAIESRASLKDQGCLSSPGVEQEIGTLF